ncbi:PIN domain-like protein [Auricularia subglabra TFB-10046 SS5]|nr:PIN domain-like protein [Auricularia subglabra TFB-10046 SS5]
MGVLGLTPFLQKKVPQVFREIPNRLRGLKDKTVVIDGTLITQRLHYSPAPHEYRHVLGWHRIIRQLQHSGVGVICVFDGPERTLAKMRERERRQAMRNLALVRGTIEVERVNRLDQLSKLIQTFHALPNDKRTAALQQLQTPPTGSLVDAPEPSEQVLPDALRSDVAPRWSYRRPQVVHRWVSPYAALAASPTPPSPSTSPGPEDTAPRIAYSRPIIVHRWVPPSLSTDYVLPTPGPEITVYHDHEPVETYDAHTYSDDFIGTDFSAVEQGDILYDGAVDELRDTKVFAWDLEELGLPKQELEALIADIDSERMRRLPAVDESSITQSLGKLYSDYRQSIPKFRVPARFEQHLEVQAESEYAMSRYQYELMLQEGALWESLTAPDASDTAHALHVRSAAIAASYAKRNAAPSKATYEESQQMLRALGVPCLSSDGPHEGEAFASALVHAGVADYVASEDTDVLVYEAPLLRGLTNLRSPLTVISGSEVREALGLSRAAFVDFALLLGTDFSRRLRGLGPMRSIALIKQHETIEAVLAARSEPMADADREEYLHEIALARAVFNSLPDVSPATVGAPPEADEALVRELLHTYGLTHAAAEDDEPAGFGESGFGAEFWLESGHGEAAPNIGVDMFRDRPDAAILVHA